MTPAEIKTLREACGLSQGWLARRANVNERTVRYWESGKHAVPDDVAAMIAGVDEMLRIGAEQALAQAKTLRNEHGAPETVELYRYADDDALWVAHPDMRPLPATAPPR
jgi:DNA-binding XRE family transcriptional regulator